MKIKLLVAAAILSTVMSWSAHAKDYVFSVSADYSGPFADVMPNAMSGINAVTDWWNKEVGPKLGVKVTSKIYDMRYDPAEIAKTWPAILSSDAPIVHLGFGSPDLTTLMKRLPNDKVPMIIGTAMVGLVWVPNGWHFSIRPTYSHEFAGLLSYLQQKKGGKLVIGPISTQNQAGFVDQVNGVRKLAATYPDKFEVLDTQWVETAPVSLAANIRTLAAGKPDVLLVGGTTAQVVGAVKAMNELNVKIPIISSTHNGLTEAAKGIGLPQLEGSYSAFSFAAPNVRQAVSSAPAFLAMVQRSYPAIYRPSSVAFLKPEGRDGQAIQRVQVVDSDGDAWLAIYSLQLQKDKSWRITGCNIVANKGRMA